MFKDLKQHIPIILFLVYAGLLFDAELFTTEGVYERDGFYHARYSQLLPERGLSRSFPWMQFTAWADSFCDKDFLYHVFLAPFCQNSAEPLAGAKTATLVLDLFLLLLFYVVLHRLKAPWPFMWTVLLAFGSGIFLNRILMVRSHVLSISLMIMGTYAILRRRHWMCFWIAFLYAWSYSFAPALLITAFGAEAGRGVVGLKSLAFESRSLSRPWWRHLQIPMVIGLGILSGLLIHPYSPHSISSVSSFFSIAKSGVTGFPLELGSEFQPIGIPELLVAMPGLVGAMLAALVGVFFIWRRPTQERKFSDQSAAALGAALTWFIGAFVFSRLIEYFAPIMLLSSALIFRDLFGGKVSNILNFSMPDRRPKALGMLLLVTAFLAGCQYISFFEVRAVARSTRPSFSSHDAWRRNRYFDGAATWMNENLAAHQTVLNFHWDDFPELFYAAPRQYYVVGLDPTFMRLSYPEHSRILEEMRTKKRSLDFALLKRLFNTEYLIMRNFRANQYPELKQGLMRPVYADDGAAIYSLSLDK